MEFYKLTDDLGVPLARSTNNPNNLNWQIIHYLDLVHMASKEKIINKMSNMGAKTDSIVGSLAHLQRNKVIEDTNKTEQYKSPFKF